MLTADRNKNEAKLFRILFLICSIITPIITYSIAEDSYSMQASIFVGWITSISFFTCFLLSYIIHGIKENLRMVFYVAIFITTICSVYFAYANKFNIEFTVLLILTILTFSVIVNKPFLLFVYCTVNMGLVLVCMHLSEETQIAKLTLSICFIIFYFISNLNAWVRYIEQRKLKMSEEKIRLLITQMQQGLAVHEIICDKNGAPVDYRFVSVNESYERITGLKSEQIVGKTVLEILPHTEKYWIETYGKVALTGEPCQFENYSLELNKYFSISAFSPRKNHFAVVVTDITKRKKAEQEIEYLSYHDQLTGLYNRRYYEQEILKIDIAKNYPLTLVMADVNGLKLTNDAFGHFTGDAMLKKISGILISECGKRGIVARIGGDEFVLLLPQTDEKEAEGIIERINKATEIEKMGNIFLSVSVGYATKYSASGTMDEIFMKAEDDMYRHKLSERCSMRSKTIDLILNSLYEKNNREMLHSMRVSDLCEKIASCMNFTKDDINKIRIAGLVHDIGKIGIAEKILDKPRSLDKNDWDEIKRHTEIGYRILSSVNEFSEISDYVLEHHERWDGTGYPKGLRGKEICIEARIISLADTFDAMTSDRPYRKALSHEEAIKEIVKCSGTQFDPDIAQLFVQTVLEQDDSSQSA